MTDDLVRERALETLEQIRTALNDDDLQTALNQIDNLKSALASWTRREVREWLDNALRGDLLTFNAQEARQRLDQWKNAAPEDQRDFEYYTQRIEERAKEKQTELQVRGTVAHCEGLWFEASRLEQSEQPPKPEFVMENFYVKALNIARSTAGEHTSNASLDALVQRGETLKRNKTIANRAYKQAIEEDEYGEMLDELTNLPADMLVPRYRVITEPDSAELTAFDSMISRDKAREEIERLARIWAGDRSEICLREGEELLNAYQPQEALDTLSEWQKLERFVGENIRDALQQMDQRARDDLQRREQAERRARHAQRLTGENPMGAWDVYAEAYHTYPGAPGLNSARKAIVTRLNEQLERLILDAEQALNAKQMERVEQIYRSARVNYTNKDPSLDEKLAQMEDINAEAQRFREYVTNAHQLLDRIQQEMEIDLNRAGEMLTQLEHLPSVVLDEVKDLPAVRDEIRQRLKLEVVHNQLYNALLSREFGEVESAIVSANEHDDPRFHDLKIDLQLHLNFLRARQHYATGQIDETKVLLSAVADTDGHPDQEAAQQLLDEMGDDSPSETTT